jgi:hypothetical protein
MADGCQVERDVTILGRQFGLDVIAVERQLWLHVAAEQSAIDPVAVARELWLHVVAVEELELGVVAVGRQLEFEMVAVEQQSDLDVGPAERLELEAIPVGQLELDVIPVEPLQLDRVAAVQPAVAFGVYDSSCPYLLIIPIDLSSTRHIRPAVWD